MDKTFALLTASIVHFIFLVLSNLISYKYKVYFLQGLSTIGITLGLLTLITYNNVNNLNSNITYYSLMLAIPFIYHFLYILLFSRDMFTKGKAMKLYILAAIMVYISAIWYFVKN